jgi:hypothetical protein
MTGKHRKRRSRGRMRTCIVVGERRKESQSQREAADKGSSELASPIVPETSP